MTSVNVYHQAKFRWTENLTSRFIQLRKENGKLFTGRKYSAQVGWEHILCKMTHEFPTIMADVQYRVLKKKWSNLLQQYKELKNPVHGDKNKADDVSWPFYSAIEEVVMGKDNRNPTLQRDIEEEDVDPHEFLCVSVTPGDNSPSPSPIEEKYPVQFSRNNLRPMNKKSPPMPELIVTSRKRLRDPLDIEDRSSCLNSNTSDSSLAKSKLDANPSIIVKDLSKLRRSENPSRVSQQLQIIRTAVNHAKRPRQALGREVKRARKTLAGFPRNRGDSSGVESREDGLESKLNEFFEYTKQRDEENRLLMLRILQAVEKIADKFE